MKIQTISFPYYMSHVYVSISNPNAMFYLLSANLYCISLGIRETNKYDIWIKDSSITNLASVNVN